MTKGFSLWLDVLRVLATVVVVLSHWAYPRFTQGDFIVIREWNLGSDAVIIFFVISGLVIAYAAGRDNDGGTFTFNRLTRLWSVLIPALVLTFAFDRFGVGISTQAYPAQFYHPKEFWDFMVRGISFSNEFRLFDRMRLGTNGPLWSISYEAAYYALFAAAFFLRGYRMVVVVAALVALIGVPILLLMPSWLLGVFIWHAVRRGRFVPRTTAVALAMAIGAPALYAASIAVGLPPALEAFTADLFGVERASRALGFSDEFIWNAIIGILTTIHLLGMARLMRLRTADIGWIRWAAGASFSVYVTHYPTLHLLDAILPEPMVGRYAVLLIGAFAVGLMFAAVFERNLKPLRAALRRLRPQPA